MARSISGGFREEKPKPKPLPLRDRIDPTLRQFEQLEMLEAELEREYAAVPSRMDADEYFHSLGIIQSQREALGRKQARLAGIPPQRAAKEESITVKAVMHQAYDGIYLPVWRLMNSKAAFVALILFILFASRA